MVTFTLSDRLPEILTDRLVLVPLRVDHAEEMAELLADPALHEFIGGSPMRADELRARYERLVAGSPDPAVAWCNWVVRLEEEGRLVGTVQATVSAAHTAPGATDVPVGTANAAPGTTDATGDRVDGPVAEVAWVVGTRWQGRGIATEAARGLVHWLGLQQVETVVAHVHPDHHASAAVAAAAGLGATGERYDGEVRWRSDRGRPRPAGTAGYREAAAELTRRYESVTFEQVHRAVLHLLPAEPARVLDIGAGTGRDAAALAARGHAVTAVEPTGELRAHRGFRWLADSLPELRSVDGRFDLVLLTAVWMHLDAPERRLAMRRITALLAPGGRVLLLLRHGPVPPGRLMFPVSADETAALGGEFGLTEVHRSERSDGHGRAAVSWTHLGLAAPEVLPVRA